MQMMQIWLRICCKINFHWDFFIEKKIKSTYISNSAHPLHNTLKWYTPPPSRYKAMNAFPNIQFTQIKWIVDSDSPIIKSSHTSIAYLIEFSRCISQINHYSFAKDWEKIEMIEYIDFIFLHKNCFIKIISYMRVRW